MYPRWTRLAAPQPCLPAPDNPAPPDPRRRPFDPLPAARDRLLSRTPPYRRYNPVKAVKNPPRLTGL